MPLITSIDQSAPPCSDHAAAVSALDTHRPPLSDAAWRALMLRYGGALRHTVSRRVSLVSDADYLVQQALLQAVVGWSTFRGPDGQVKFPHPWPPQIPPGRTVGL